jgi:hypothetical protein
MLLKGRRVRDRSTATIATDLDGLLKIDVRWAIALLQSIPDPDHSPSQWPGTTPRSHQILPHVAHPPVHRGWGCTTAIGEPTLAGAVQRSSFLSLSWQPHLHCRPHADPTGQPIKLANAGKKALSPDAPFCCGTNTNVFELRESRRAPFGADAPGHFDDDMLILPSSHLHD